MIIGMDLFTKLGIDALNSMGSIRWYGVEIPMRPRDSTIEDFFSIENHQTVQDSSKRINNILDVEWSVLKETTNLNYDILGLRQLFWRRTFWSKCPMRNL